MEHTTCWDLANVPYMGYWPRPERVKKKKKKWKEKNLADNLRIKVQYIIIWDK
jgi:methionine synthase II (cobalamin-independent)